MRRALLQLLPAEIFSDTPVRKVKWQAPCCTIEDEPEFAYRGFLFDCGRYFFPKEEVMKFIDLMAMHKQNMFHWHLTEDQGWRIQIDKYPRLTGDPRPQHCRHRRLPRAQLLPGA